MSLQWSVTQAIMWLPLVFQTFPCPRLASAVSFSQSPSYPTITSKELFLLLSYDVLWPCSGSRTGTVLSLCHLIDTLLLVTCAYIETINQVTGSTSPGACAPANVSDGLYKGCTRLFRKCHFPDISGFYYCSFFLFSIVFFVVKFDNNLRKNVEVLFWKVLWMI